MYPDPDGRRMHLFYLANLPEGPWDRIGHAVSEDLLTWEAMPTIVPTHEDNEPSAVGTGMCFTFDTHHYMTFTQNLSGIKNQSIAFMRSKDLIHWEQAALPQIVPMGPYYETDAQKCQSKQLPFRDAFILKNGRQYEALITAACKEGPDGLRGCIARYRARNEDLSEWEPLPPLLGPGVQSQMEVAEHCEINGGHYLLWSNNHFMGPPIRAAGHEGCTGTFYAMANHYEGPYELPEDNLLVGARDYPCTIQSYVGRIVQWGGRHLLYHHVSGHHPAFGLPKELTQDTDGTLAVCYWDQIERLHGKRIDLEWKAIETFGQNHLSEEWAAIDGDSLRGRTHGIGSAAYLQGEYSHMHLRCRMTLDSAKRAGVSVRDSMESGRESGVMLVADCEGGLWQLARPLGLTCRFPSPFESHKQAPKRGETYNIDIICRDEFYEVYVDGRWTFTRWFEDLPSAGRIAFYVENGAATFDSIAAWELESIDT